MISILLLSLLTFQDSPKAHASLQSTLKTRNANIRQLAFDHDESTFFESTDAPKLEDSLTLNIDRPIKLNSVKTKANVEFQIETSSDGKNYLPFSTLPAAGEVKAIRLKPIKASDSVLRIRPEITSRLRHSLLDCPSLGATGGIPPVPFDVASPSTGRVRPVAP